jgi:hypothetical protein
LCIGDQIGKVFVQRQRNIVAVVVVDDAIGPAAAQGEAVGLDPGCWVELHD